MTNTDTDRALAEPYEVKYPLPEEVDEVIKRLYDAERKARENAVRFGNEGDEKNREEQLTLFSQYKSQLNAYLYTLNRDYGWALRALSNGMYNVWVQTVSNRVAEHEKSMEEDIEPADVSHLPLPESPRKEERLVERKSQRAKPPAYVIPEGRVNELRRLGDLAKKLRGSTSEEDPKFQAAKRLANLLDEEIRNGATVSQLARILGVTAGAINARLGRWGKKEPYPSAASTVNRTLRPGYAEKIAS